MTVLPRDGPKPGLQAHDRTVDTARPSAAGRDPARRRSNPRHRAREFVLQGLYQWLVGGQDMAAIEAQAAGVPGFDKADQVLYVALLSQSLDHAAALQDLLRKHIDRPWAEISPIERGILLLSACEFSRFPETPYRVVLNEAIELAKDFGGTDGHKFVNGVLDKLAAELRPAEAGEELTGAAAGNTPVATAGLGGFVVSKVPSEFELIARYFTRPTTHTLLGAGDDGAIVRPSPGMELVISTDMLVAGTHFLPDADPEALGWKSLAVNISDLAAMGAQPRWALLAASLPDADEVWIAAYAHGFFACASAFGVDLIGGDTTRGPMNFCVSILGEVFPGRALLRSGASPGDQIWVSGAPGRAALALAHLQGKCVLRDPALADCLEALHRPQPRVALGLALAGLASAAIDVSDGLLADLGHILERSGVAANVRADRLPDAATRACPGDPALAHRCLLAGGDDYELVFTVPPDRHNEIMNLAGTLGLALTCIGDITGTGLGELTLMDAERIPPHTSGL